VSAWAFARIEDVRDSKGQEPCIPPDVLAVAVERALLGVTVAKDEATEPEIH
jgi:hypothetical protein